MMDHQKEKNHGFAHIDIDDHPTWKKGAKQINTSLFPGSSQKFSDQIILPRDHPKTPPGLVDTEGVRDHVTKARRLDLPHVNFFDAAFEKAVLCWMRWWMERLSKSWVPALQNMLVTENFGSKAHSETNIRIWHKFNEETAVQGRFIGGDFLFAWREKNIQQKSYFSQHSHDLIVAIGLHGCTTRSQPYFLQSSSTNSDLCRIWQTSGFGSILNYHFELRVYRGWDDVSQTCCLLFIQERDNIQIAIKTRGSKSSRVGCPPDFGRSPFIYSPKQIHQPPFTNGVFPPCRRSFVLKLRQFSRSPPKSGMVAPINHQKDDWNSLKPYINLYKYVAPLRCRISHLSTTQIHRSADQTPQCSGWWQRHRRAINPSPCRTPPKSWALRGASAADGVN